MTTWALAFEALRDQEAWRGTLALHAWREALLAARSGWALQGHYRFGVLQGWVAAGLPAALLLGWRRWRTRAERDALAALGHRSRVFVLLLLLAAGSAAYLGAPAPLPPPATPAWAALLLLGLAGLP